MNTVLTAESFEGLVEDFNKSTNLLDIASTLRVMAEMVVVEYLSDNLFTETILNDSLIGDFSYDLFEKIRDNDYFESLVDIAEIELMFSDSFDVLEESAATMTADKIKHAAGAPSRALYNAARKVAGAADRYVSRVATKQLRSKVASMTKEKKMHLNKLSAIRKQLENVDKLKAKVRNEERKSAGHGVLKRALLGATDKVRRSSKLDAQYGAAYAAKKQALKSQEAAIKKSLEKIRQDKKAAFDAARKAGRKSAIKTDNSKFDKSRAKAREAAKKAKDSDKKKLEAEALKKAHEAGKAAERKRLLGKIVENSELSENVLDIRVNSILEKLV